jgi:hypothetical protein
MDKRAGRQTAQQKGICLHIGGGRVAGTCGRKLRRDGTCKTHGDDIYTSATGQ